ncbi:MAG TPA: DUF58 domain-containing protein [Planctomycetaceae bacterium]|nr:DUF58 domain-containing protein [Planctomycetaceae bacterium]
MTALAKWLALASITGLCLGILREQIGLSLLSLSVLVWLLVEWLLFAWRVRIELRALKLERSVNGRSERTGVLWAGRNVSVEVHLRSSMIGIGPLVKIRDVVPENLGVSNHAHDVTIRSRVHSAVFRYEARVLGAGQLRLPGFRIVMRDAQGFFRTERFFPLVQTFRVLPAFMAVGDAQPIVKRINSLPQHGIHRLQRSGMGSELLELREYVAGDPPKSIAWKVSARRDKLMTRQYESEVPVRLQLFVDGSIGTRTGGFGLRLLDQMNFVAASVAKAAISAGDPVGAILFDERGLRRVPSATGDRGFHRLLEALSDFSVNPAPSPDRLTNQLLDAAMSVVAEQFPELMDARVNHIPFFLFPISPWAHRRLRNRYQLAAVIAHLYRLSPAKQIRLVYDDGLMATYAQHFLSQSGMAWMEPVVTIRSRGFHDGMARMEILSAALARAVSQARDNEVFVVMADLLECVPSLSHLMPAVKMALARHHRVAFVCPSPTFRRPTAESTNIRSLSLQDLVLAAEQTRTRDLASRLQYELRRIGATVSISGEANAIQLVLSEMAIARTGRVAAGGVR